MDFTTEFSPRESFSGSIIPVPPSVPDDRILAKYPGFRIGFLLTLQSDPTAALAAFFQKDDAKQSDAQKQLADAAAFESTEDAMEAGSALLSSPEIQSLPSVSRRMSMWIAQFKQQHAKLLRRKDGTRVPGEYLQHLFTAVGGERDEREVEKYFKKNLVSQIRGHKAFEGAGYYIALSEDVAKILIQQGTGADYIKVAFDTDRTGIKAATRRWVYESWIKPPDIEMPIDPVVRNPKREEMGTPRLSRRTASYSDFHNRVSALNKPKSGAEVTVSAPKEPGAEPASGETYRTGAEGADLFLHLVWATLARLRISTDPNADPLSRVEAFASRIEEVTGLMPKIAVTHGINGFLVRPTGEDPLAGGEYFVFYSAT